MIKRFLWILLLASGLQTSWAFSLVGPVANGGDAWQVGQLSYGSPYDDIAPKQLGQGYRRNIPVMYYTYDANFLNYFGESGVTAVDGAFTILNAMTNVDSYSKQLSEFSVETRSQNYTAQALGLFDLKSWTLQGLMKQFGLADPVRYAWDLHDRVLPSGATCPFFEYLVVQRNYDYFPTALNQYQTTAYVNNTLYSYLIEEFCPVVDRAVTVPYSVDPLADIYSPVACYLDNLDWGDYFTGLTRDDVGGLRYLLSTNLINWETPAADALAVVTNTTEQDLFPVNITTNGGVVFNGIPYGTASYGALVSFSQTNNAAAVQAAFPGVQVTLLANYFTNVIVTNIVTYFTNYYGEAIGTPPHLVTKNVLTPTIVEYYQYAFDNIITNLYSATTKAQIQSITVGPAPGSAIGSPSVTNVSTKTITVNVPSGEFYILPTNSPCGLDILYTLLTFTNYATNVLTATSTNAVTGTNNTGTNTLYAYSQNEVTPTLSHIYAINPVTCVTSNAVPGLYQGIGNIKFVRADYDSELGQYWQPVTNDYSMILITNSQAHVQHFRRVVTQLDIVFSGVDVVPGPSATPGRGIWQVNAPPFDTANVLPGLAGPGTIVPPTTIAFNIGGGAYFNTPLDTMTGTTYFRQSPGGDITDLFYGAYFTWASFDGTTNPPVVYPNGTSLQNLANQVLIQVSPTTLPLGIGDGQHPYPATTFTATGGAFTQPYTWSATPLTGSAAALPAGLTLSPSGTLSGTPTQSGTFDFNLVLTDYVGRSVQWAYTITIQ